MASEHADRRGPRLGDAASLWNFAPAPGWSKQEAHILRLCLQKFGVGRWVQIIESGLLPGKLIQQLNGQTQRLLGQQSLAAYTGLRVDIDRIRADNQAKAEGVERKGGLIIWSGPNPTKQMKEEWRKEAQAKYGLTKEQIAEAEQQLEGLQPDDEAPAVAAAEQQRNDASSSLDMMGASTESLPWSHKAELLRLLHRKLQYLAGLMELHGLKMDMPEGFTGFESLKDGVEQSSEAAKPMTSSEQQPAAAAAQAPEPTAKAQGEGGEVLLETTNKPAAAAVTADKEGKSAKASNGKTANGKAVGSAQRGTKRKPAAAAAGGAKPTKQRGKAAGKAPGKAKAPASKASGSGKKYVEDSDEEGGGEEGDNPLAVLLKELTGMGFAQDKARDALDACGGDVESSIEWLMVNCV